MVMLTASMLSAHAQEAYAVLNGTTFTFYYDDLKATREGQIFSTDNVQTDLLGLCPQWMEIYDNGGWRNSLFSVTTVVFDPSFADARPTSTSLWFEGCNNLEKIEGLEYLNTSEVTSMNEMFYACDKLKEIDLSHFNTSKVETVDKMFLGCIGLTNLDLSSFDCSNLNVAGSKLIRTCVSLKSLTIAEGMYFNDGDCMFVGTAENPCVINYPEDYVFGVDTSGDYFEWCSGYFKLGEAYTSVEKEAYAWLSEDGKTLTFCYDDKKEERDGTTYYLNGNEELPAWFGGWSGESSVQKVIFNPSFADVKPTTTNLWFGMMPRLKEIIGLNFLNTSNCTNMVYMFYGSYNLEALDVSNFDISKIDPDYTTYMFGNCRGLEALTISSSMNNLQDEACISVGSADNPCLIIAPEGFDFGVDTSGDYFVWKSGYFTLNPTNKAYAWMSEDGKTLTFCYDDKKRERVGTTYYLNGEWENPAWFPGWGITSSVQKVVFNPSFADVRPIDINKWFAYMGELEEITGLNFLNTSNCTNLYMLFYGCQKLKTLDVSNLDISNSTSTWGMLGNCIGLEKLTISSSMGSLDESACQYVGTAETPCTIIAPEGFDFGVDTSGDYFVWKSGYFKIENATTPAEKEAYAVYNNGTFTFYYDELKTSREGQVYSTDEADYEYGVPKWLQYNGNSFDQTLTDVTKVVFDPSYADARPTKTAEWFLDMSNLTTIEGMEYLNTSNVGEMENMFSGCGSLTSIDLSHFDTSNVFNMYGLFAFCYNLQELDLSNFDTSNVTNMNSAFVWCSSLKSINVSSFNTSKVELFMGIFARCSSLETLDVSNFDISNATGDWYGMSRTDAMFTGCSNLKNLSISSSMGNLSDNACEGVGTPENPSLLIAPEGFDYGVDTSGDYFQWKTGYFMLENATPLVTLTGGDNEVPLSEYDGMTVDVELDDYTCQPDKWYSLCVPFDLSNDQLKEAFGDDANIQEMIGCTWDAENLTMSMNFNKVTEILAGKPYLLRVSGAVKDPKFEGVTINSADPLALDFGDCEMIGVLNATPLPLGDKSYLFIINNQFYYPATTNPLPAMRCYFHLLGDAAGANSVALNMEDDPNAIISDITDKAADSGLYHSLQGIATNRPHRGVYIINGKKVVVK